MQERLDRWRQGLTPKPGVFWPRPEQPFGTTDSAEAEAPEAAEQTAVDSNVAAAQPPATSYENPTPDAPDPPPPPPPPPPPFVRRRRGDPPQHQAAGTEAQAAAAAQASTAAAQAAAAKTTQQSSCGSRGSKG